MSVRDCETCANPLCGAEHSDWRTYSPPKEVTESTRWNLFIAWHKDHAMDYTRVPPRWELGTLPEMAAVGVWIRNDDEHFWVSRDFSGDVSKLLPFKDLDSALTALRMTVPEDA